MATKAELKRQVKSLKLELAEAVAGAHDTSNDNEADRTECSVELIELQQHNDTLITHLSTAGNRTVYQTPGRIGTVRETTDYGGYGT